MKKVKNIETVIETNSHRLKVIVEGISKWPSSDRNLLESQQLSAANLCCTEIIVTMLSDLCFSMQDNDVNLIASQLAISFINRPKNILLANLINRFLLEKKSLQYHQGGAISIEHLQLWIDDVKNIIGSEYTSQDDREDHKKLAQKVLVKSQEKDKDHVHQKLYSSFRKLSKEIGHKVDPESNEIIEQHLNKFHNLFREIKYNEQSLSISVFFQIEQMIFIFFDDLKSKLVEVNKTKFSFEELFAKAINAHPRDFISRLLKASLLQYYQEDFQKDLKVEKNLIKDGIEKVWSAFTRKIEHMQFKAKKIMVAN